MAQESYPDFLIEWFKSRTLNLKVLKEFKVQWDGKRIVIPVYSPEGNFLLNKYRRDPRSEEGPKYTYDRGGRVSLFGASKIKNIKQIILVEGELDALCLWSHGFPAISSTGGSGSFDEMWTLPLNEKEIIICYDNDEAGDKGALKAHLYLQNARVVRWPLLFKIKDITDYCIRAEKEGKEVKVELQKLFDNARNIKMNEWRVEKESISEHKTIIKAYKEYLIRIREVRAECQKNNLTTNFTDLCLRYVEGMIQREEKAIRIIKFKKKNPDFQNNNRSIDSAKMVPITNFIQFNHQDMAPCIFHKEKTASMHYIKKSNKVHCFGCDRTADTIEVVMQMEGLNYKDALKKLT